MNSIINLLAEELRYPLFDEKEFPFTQHYGSYRYDTDSWMTGVMKQYEFSKTVDLTNVEELDDDFINKYLLSNSTTLNSWLNFDLTKRDGDWFSIKPGYKLEIKDGYYLTVNVFE